MEKNKSRVLAFWRKKRAAMLSAFLAAMMVVTMMPVGVVRAADLIPDSQTMWALSGSGDNLTLTISGSGNMPDFTSASYQPWAAEQENITAVVIGNNVTKIGVSAFAKANLTSVTIPSSVTLIGRDAFSETSLTSVTIPSSVTKINQFAFYRSSLTSITFQGSTPPTFDGNSSFGELPTAGTVYVPIGTEDAYKTALSATGLTFSDTQWQIAGVSMKTQIGSTGVYWELTGVAPNQTLTISGTGDMPDFATESDRPWHSSISSIIAVVVEDGITAIGDRAFLNTAAASVTIPSSVITIGDRAFGNTAATSVTIPSSVTSIGLGAFANAPLTSLTIPSSVTSIGNQAFYGTALTSITFEGSDPPSIGSDVFDGMTSNTGVVTVPNGTEDTYTTALANSKIPFGNGWGFSAGSSTLYYNYDDGEFHVDSYDGAVAVAGVDFEGSYTAENNVITLNNFVFTTTAENAMVIASNPTGEATDVKFILKDGTTNKIETTGDNGIKFSNTIIFDGEEEGTGAISISGKTTGVVAVTMRRLVVNGGDVTITATDTTSNTGIGIDLRFGANNSSVLTVTGGTLTASGNNTAVAGPPITSTYDVKLRTTGSPNVDGTGIVDAYMVTYTDTTSYLCGNAASSVAKYIRIEYSPVTLFFDIETDQANPVLRKWSQYGPLALSAANVGTSGVTPDYTGKATFTSPTSGKPTLKLDNFVFETEAEIGLIVPGDIIIEVSKQGTNSYGGITLTNVNQITAKGENSVALYSTGKIYFEGNATIGGWLELVGSKAGLQAREADIKHVYVTAGGENSQYGMLFTGGGTSGLKISQETDTKAIGSEYAVYAPAYMTVTHVDISNRNTRTDGSITTDGANVGKMTTTAQLDNSYTLTVNGEPAKYARFWYQTSVENVTVVLTPGIDKTTLAAQAPSAGYTFYYKYTDTDDTINKPPLNSTALSDWTFYSSDKDIAIVDKDEIYVQVVKVDPASPDKIIAWGQAKGTPLTLEDVSAAINLSAGDGKVTLSPQSASDFTYYYKSTGASDAANKPALGDTDLSGWTQYSAATDITGANDTAIYVQIIKVDGDGKIVGWGQASATPVAGGGGSNPTTYTVSFDTNGGSVVADITGLSSGATITKPADPTKANSAFAGWYKDDALTDAWDFATDTVSGTITLYAKWTAATTYTVSFVVNGGSAVADIENLPSGSLITKPADPTKAGYSFGGWYTESALTNAWNFATDTVGGYITLFAKWTVNTQTPTPPTSPTSPKTPEISLSVKEEEGAPSTGIATSASEIADKIFTAEELARISNGEAAEVFITVEDISDKVSDEDKASVEAKLLDENGDMALAMYVDISLFKRVGSDETQLHEIDGKIQITIEVPEHLRAEGRSFKIVRVHDGVAEVLDGTYDPETGLFTFETDRFSTYALVFAEGTASEEEELLDDADGEADGEEEASDEDGLAEGEASDGSDGGDSAGNQQGTGASGSGANSGSGKEANPATGVTGTAAFMLIAGALAVASRRRK